MDERWLSLIALLGFAILVLPAALRKNRAPRVLLRNTAIWLAILAALIVLYRASR